MHILTSMQFLLYIRLYVFLIISVILHVKLAVSPLFSNLYPELEVDLGLHHVFNLTAGYCTDLLLPGAAFSDDDALVGLALADNTCFNINNTVWTLFHLFNDNGNSMRDLII